MRRLQHLLQLGLRILGGALRIQTLEARAEGCEHRPGAGRGGRGGRLLGAGRLQLLAGCDRLTQRLGPAYLLLGQPSAGLGLGELAARVAHRRGFPLRRDLAEGADDVAHGFDLHDHRLHARHGRSTRRGAVLLLVRALAREREERQEQERRPSHGRSPSASIRSLSAMLRSRHVSIAAPCTWRRRSCWTSTSGSPR